MLRVKVFLDELARTIDKNWDYFGKLRYIITFLQVSYSEAAGLRILELITSFDGKIWFIQVEAYTHDEGKKEKQARRLDQTHQEVRY